VTDQLYTQHFGFSERPFTLLPDPDFLFWSKAHRRAFTVLEYGLATRAPLTVVTGEVGIGKTTLLQALLRQMPEDTQVALISNAQGGRGDLLRWILNGFDICAPADADYVTLFQTFQDFVIAAYAEGRHVVVVIDEAQNLSVDVLEELRMLTNINANKDELLQLILMGQPELREMIQAPQLRQFAQRVTATCHLDPFDQKTTYAYIRHRLVHVGGTGNEFSPASLKTVFEHSEGIPRTINRYCDMALVYAAGTGAKAVSIGIIREIIDDEIILKPRAAPYVLDETMMHKTTRTRPNEH
jgi:general secretion pathway protein A